MQHRERALILWEQAKSYAKDYRWDKLAADTVSDFATGFLDPISGGMASIAKKVIKHGNNVVQNVLDCVHDKKPFFSWENAPWP